MRAGRARSGRASALLADARRSTWRTSRARSASCARTSGWSVRTMRSSHQRWSWPQRSAGASGSPSLSVGAAPVSVGALRARRALLTAPSSPSAASASAWPGDGPKPARQSRRSAWRDAERARVHRDRRRDRGRRRRRRRARRAAAASAGRRLDLLALLRRAQRALGLALGDAALARLALRRAQRPPGARARCSST